MRKRDLLIARLEEIGRALERTGAGVALLGLGSAGQALQRLDDHSDLDFFVIARAGSKRFFLDSLAWLETIQPVVFSFLNTADLGRWMSVCQGLVCLRQETDLSLRIENHIPGR